MLRLGLLLPAAVVEDDFLLLPANDVEVCLCDVRIEEEEDDDRPLPVLDLSVRPVRGVTDTPPPAFLTAAVDGFLTAGVWLSSGVSLGELYVVDDDGSAGGEGGDEVVEEVSATPSDSEEDLKQENIYVCKRNIMNHKM